MSTTNSKLTRVADNIRILSAAMVEKAKSGHPGGAMGGADFITVLFAEFLRYDPDNMTYPYRDRFFLDPGHMSPMLYSTLALAGHYSTEDLQSLRQWGSVTPGHPEADFARGVENTSGPLGQGHAMALGAAIAERFMAARFGEWMAHKTYAYISDGAVEEEISQGVGRIAGHLGLSNFIMYYDSNNIQLSTKVDEVMTENVAMKYEAWGWNVLSVDGHNINEIREALVAANSETERPTLIIGRTVMGKGAKGPSGESFEDKVSTHGQPLTAAGADFAATVKNLGGDPNGVGLKRCNDLIYKVVTSLYGRIDNEMATVYFQPIALKYRCELTGVAIIEIVQCCTTRPMSISYTQKIGKPYSTVHFSRKLSRRTTSSSYRSSVGKRRLARLLMNWLPKPLP